MQCITCGRAAKPARRQRCQRCYQHALADGTIARSAVGQTQPGTLERLLERLVARTEFAESGCWLWPEKQTQNKGYGSIRYQGRTRSVHTLAYETLVGPVPTGYELDHTCRVRRCWNPSHLEPVTHTVNLQRGAGPERTRERLAAQETCKRGHPFTPENTKLNFIEGRYYVRTCRTCARDRMRRVRAAQKTEVAVL